MFLDLHRHLEGSHSPEALAHVAQTFDIRRAPFYDEATRHFRSGPELRAFLTMPAPSEDANQFYKCIVQSRIAYVSLPAIALLAELSFREAAAETDGFEMRLSLFSMARTLAENLGVEWRKVEPTKFVEQYARPILDAVLAAKAKVAFETRKPMILRVGFSRTFESEPHYRALADMLVEYKRELVGLDVLGIVTTGDKEPLPPALREIIQGLRKHLPDLTIHAGEFEGHHSVDRTLELEPSGIGHGIHSLQSGATLDRLAREGVTLEVCPTSNNLLLPGALVALRRDHTHGAAPLVALQRNHVHCVLGSDDPTPMGTCFAQELRIAREIGVDLGRLESDMVRRWNQILSAR